MDAKLYRKTDVTAVGVNTTLTPVSVGIRNGHEQVALTDKPEDAAKVKEAADRQHRHTTALRRSWRGRNI